MIVLSNSRSLPVTGAFATGQPGQPAEPLTIDELFAYRIGWATASFSALSALFHAIVASSWGYPRYVDELIAHRNRFRWVEYSLSASIMIVLIAGIVGITDVAALLAIFGVNASMILFGWLMETTNGERQAGVSWTPFLMGCSLVSRCSTGATLVTRSIWSSTNPVPRWHSRSRPLPITPAPA